MEKSLGLMVEIDINCNWKIKMDNSKIYTQAFVEAFEVSENEVISLEYESIDAWDSVGHMVLMASLEEVFDIIIEMEDIIDFSGYEKGKELLSKYDISF